MPVALGDVEPPLQSIMVLDNPLDTPVAYAVDQTALRAVAEANYGFPILHCVNPSGVLPPRSMTQVHWYFRPLEAKEYSMEIPVHTYDGNVDDDDDGPVGESYSFTFVGRGYHPRETPNPDIRAMIEGSFIAIPTASPSLPSLPIALSPEVLSYGALPYFALKRTCCTLVNTHPTDTFTFEWDTHHALGDHLLTIQPARGRIPPNGGRVDCRVSFYTGSTSQLLRWSVLCRLTNETVVEEAVAANGEEASADDSMEQSAASVASSEYFAVDGKGFLQMAGKRPVAPFERTTCTKGAQIRMRRHQQARLGGTHVPVTTLPAESLGTGELTRRVLEGRQVEVETGSEAAVSAVVELLVQARVMPVEDYETVFGKASLRGIHQPLVSMFQDPNSAAMTAGAAASSTTTADEVRVAGDVLEELVSAVVAQPCVRAAVTEPRSDDAVYYHQIKSGSKDNSSKNSKAVPASESAPHEGKAGSDSILIGLVNNVLDEALEELVFQAVKSATANLGQ